MLYQLTRPYNETIYFDLPPSKTTDILPLWFGPSWQTADPSLRASAKPLLALAPDEADHLNRIHNFVREHTTGREPYFVFHGGAVTKGPDAYLFLASTTTGKTTLITYLSQTGFTYLNDDSFAVDMDALTIPPCSSPIHLRGGGYAYLQSVLPAAFSADTCRYIDAGLSSRYVLLPKDCTSQTTRVKQIFFLNRTDEEITAYCVPIPMAQALQRLFVSALVPYQMTRRHIQFFQRLAPLCQQLTYHDAPDAAALLRSLIASSEESHD